PPHLRRARCDERAPLRAPRPARGGGGPLVRGARGRSRRDGAATAGGQRGARVSALRVALGVVAGVTGGPATYGVALARALGELVDRTSPDPVGAGGEAADAVEVTVLTDRPDAFDGASGLRIVRVPLSSSWQQPWWDNVGVPRALARLGADVYHGTKHALPLVGLPRATAAVVTVHDLAVLSEPATFAPPQRLQLAVHLHHAARRADRIVCDSEHAAGDVAMRLGVAPSRIAVVPLGVSRAFRPPRDEAARRAARAALGVADGGPLASFVGTAQPRKHVEVAIEAIAALRARGLDATLAIAGRRRPGYEPAWLVAPPPWVRLLGEVPAERLVELYGASDVMVSPSTYEGFGLTFAEAMACGCPVVGVAATSVPEVVRGGGLLVERAEAALVADAIERLLRDPDLRARTVVAALARAAELTWERAAESTLAVQRAAARAAAARNAGARAGGAR